MPLPLTRRAALAGGGAVLAAGRARLRSVDIDLGAFPDTAQWAHEAARAISEWWTRIVAALSITDFDRVRLHMREIEPRSIAAITIKNVINVDGAHVRAGRIGIGLVAHELVHVVQDYPDGATTWIKEGMADYFRFHVLLPNDPERQAVSPQSDFRNGYQPAAALLASLTERFGCRIVRDLNLAMRAGEDGDAAIQHLTGQSAEASWRDLFPTGRDLSGSSRRR